MNSTRSQVADGFIVVKHRRYKKKHFKKPIVRSINYTDSEGIHLDRSKIELLQEEIKSSEFFSEVKKTLNIALSNPGVDGSIKLTDSLAKLSISSPSEIDFVCYGLGRFFSCVIARYQLALVMLIKDWLRLSTVAIFDPVHTTEEISFLKDLGLDVLDVNEEAKRKILRKTVFFMPHCEYNLLNNLLQANWEKEDLPNLVIYGNSFDNLILTYTLKDLIQNAPYIYLANQVVSEVKIENSFRFTDIFNDLSVHYFPPKNLNRFRKSVEFLNIKMEL